MLELSSENMHRAKIGVHISQALLIFVGWAITIALLQSSADGDGRIYWYFGLCFLSVPALIYQTMTPLFPRSRKFVNAYAFCGVDIFFAILWLSAFAAVASYGSTGKCNKDCNLSSALTGLGVLICLLFCVTTAISAHGVAYFMRTGNLPNYRIPQNAAQMIDPDKEAFSTAPVDDDYAPVHGNDNDHEDHIGPSDHYARNDYGSSYSGSSSYGGGGGDSYAMNTPYASTSGPGAHNVSFSGYGNSSSLHEAANTDTGYAGAGAGRAQFPAASYS